MVHAYLQVIDFQEKIITTVDSQSCISSHKSEVRIKKMHCYCMNAILITMYEISRSLVEKVCGKTHWGIMEGDTRSGMRIGGNMGICLGVGINWR